MSTSFIIRLFVSINFNDEIKAELAGAIAQLRQISSSGNFSLIDNLHLTLAFIGETERISDVKRIIDSVSFPRFDITLGAPGVFRRDGGDIRWVGIEKNPSLSALANEISQKLISEGFDIDTRDFKPHITIARQVVCPRQSAIKVDPIRMTADRISLMRSDRIGSVLKYTEIYSKKLG